MAANYWADVQTDLEKGMSVVWPEIGASFTVVIAKKINWYNLMQDKQMGNVYAIMQFVSCTAGEWGLNNLVYEVEVALFYITLDPPDGVVNLLFDKVRAMQDYLLNPATVFTGIVLVLDEGMSLDAGEDEAASEMAESNMPLTAASLKFTCLVGQRLLV